MNKITRLRINGRRAICFSAFCMAALTVGATTDATKDADNTAQNERDRNHAEVTPRDQGNSREDIDITTRIRKAIIANKSLSMNAHNVKVITLNGHVTLRGPVENDEEKRMICDIAADVASRENVDSRLEVKMDNAGK